MADPLDLEHAIAEGRMQERAAIVAYLRDAADVEPAVTAIAPGARGADNYVRLLADEIEKGEHLGDENT